jgi:hypothetical protein
VSDIAGAIAGAVVDIVVSEVDSVLVVVPSHQADKNAPTVRTSINFFMLFNFKIFD